MRIYLFRNSIALTITKAQYAYHCTVCLPRSETYGTLADSGKYAVGCRHHTVSHQPFLQNHPLPPLPDDARALSFDTITLYLTSLSKLPFNTADSLTLLEVSEHLNWILPHRVHRSACDDACAKPLNMTLTLLLWETYLVAQHLDESGVVFDRSHRFLLTVLLGTFACADPHSNRPCPEHEEDEVRSNRLVSCRALKQRVGWPNRP